MNKHTKLGASALLLASSALSAQAADTAYDRLANPSKEPQNWLMTSHDYNNWRHSDLDTVSKTNVTNLKLAFIFSIGGRSTGGTLPGREEATPLVEDGFMYVPDSWDRVMKFDVRSGTAGVPLWRYDPKITKSRTVRGVALLNDNVYVATNDTRIIALNKESGEVVFDKQAAAPPDPTTGTPSAKTQGFTASPQTLRTKAGRELVVQGESTGGQQGTRSWVGAFDAKTGDLVWRFFTVPAPGEPGSETWKDNHNAWRIGGAGVWSTGAYDPDNNIIIHGTGDAFPSFDPEFRPGDNLFSASNIAVDVDTGKLKWYFQETPNEHWDFDTPNNKMLYTVNIGGQDRKVVGDFSRNGFYYTLDRVTGQFLRADQYQEKVTWTAGIDPKTGKPVDYDPAGGVQNYAGVGGRRGKSTTESCPTFVSAPTFYPPTFDPDRMRAYAAGGEGCFSGAAIGTPMDEKKDYVGQAACCFTIGPETVRGAIWAYDVRNGKVAARATYEINSESGLASTKSGLVFHGHPTGKFAAYDADDMKELWSYSLGMPITAPPITYAVGGKQYIAVVAGGSAGTGKTALYQPSAIVAVFGL